MPGVPQKLKSFAGLTVPGAVLQQAAQQTISVFYDFLLSADCGEWAAHP